MDTKSRIISLGVIIAFAVVVFSFILISLGLEAFVKAMRLVVYVLILAFALTLLAIKKLRDSTVDQ